MLRALFAILGALAIVCGLREGRYLAVVGGVLLLLAALFLHRALHVSMLVREGGER